MDIAFLKDQLTRYPQLDITHYNRCLSEGRLELFSKVYEYNEKHLDKIKEYNPSYVGKDDPLYFRKAFIDYIGSLSPEMDEDARRKRIEKPMDATSTMDNLLGVEGRQLYQKALEEEANDALYRIAVFNASTQHVSGDRWKTKPLMIIGGPSASGKSFATKHVIKETDALLKKDPQNKSGNYVVAVDGGVAREVSQMRKLAIRFALSKGYSGIKDLHERSKALEPTKGYVKNAAFKEPGVGIAIPETFSQYYIPFLWQSCSDLITQDCMQPGVTPVFAQVKGATDSFQSVVKHMGNARAWTSAEPTVGLDLNSTEDLPESKQYGAGGFSWGQSGTEAAIARFKVLQQEKGPVYTMNILNDLILLKSTPDGRWEKAEPGDKDALLVSQKNYEDWIKIPEDSRLPLQDYNKAHATPSMEFSEDILRTKEAHASAAQRMAAYKQALQEHKQEAEASKKEDEIRPPTSPR